MYKIKSSYCEAFKTDEELNAMISTYVELKKKDLVEAIDFASSFRKQMNDEGKIDLQKVLEDAFANDYSYGEKEPVEVLKTKEMAFLEDCIEKYGYEKVFNAVLLRHDGDKKKAELTMSAPTAKTEKWFKSINSILSIK